MSLYSEKLLDPRWQRKRLGVLERADWKCECCGDSEETLHVHHLIYSGEPWDAPLENLECLCESCHTFREEFNEITGTRSRISTRLCFRFLRFSAVAQKKPEVIDFSRQPEEFLRFCKCLDKAMKEETNGIHQTV